MLNTEGHAAGDVPERKKPPARVVLTGFRGAGKSQVGSRLAELISYRFIDTDGELVARIKCSVAEFVREHGWPAFRQLEKDLLARLAWMNGVVIATGGGAILHRHEWQVLRQDSLVVWLQADVRTIRERLLADPESRGQRPSLTGGDNLEEVAAVLAEREPCYREGSDLAVDTSGRSPEEIADLIRQFITVGEDE